MLIIYVSWFTYKCNMHLKEYGTGVAKLKNTTRAHAKPFLCDSHLWMKRRASNVNKLCMCCSFSHTESESESKNIDFLSCSFLYWKWIYFNRCCKFSVVDLCVMLPIKFIENSEQCNDILRMHKIIHYSVLWKELSLCLTIYISLLIFISRYF